MRILLLILLLIPNLSWAVSSGWYSTLQGNNSDVQSGSIPDGSTLQYSTSAGQWQFSYATVPAGGSTGYVLTKNSNSNYDYSWKPGGSGSAWNITDGSNTVNGVTQLTVTGGTVGGTTPNATLTITGGSGTVTTVSVVSANGHSGTVANPTTTPAITLNPVNNGGINWTNFDTANTNWPNAVLTSNAVGGVNWSVNIGTSNASNSFDLSQWWNVIQRPGDTQVVSMTYSSQSSIVADGSLFLGTYNQTPGSIIQYNEDNLNGQTVYNLSGSDASIGEFTFVKSNNTVYGITLTGSVYALNLTTKILTKVITNTWTAGNFTSITNDGTYLYLMPSNSAVTGIIYQYAISSYSQTASLTLTGLLFPSNVKYDGVSLWVTSAISSNAWVANIPLPAFNSFTSANITGCGIIADDMAVTPDYLFVGCENNLDLARVRKSDLTFTLIPTTQISYGLWYDGTSVWALQSAAGSKTIVRINPSTLEADSIVLPPAFTSSQPNEIVGDGNRLFITMWNGGGGSTQVGRVAINSLNSNPTFINNVGIGTFVPGTALDVQGTIRGTGLNVYDGVNNPFTVLSTGSVEIGTTGQGGLLSVGTPAGNGIMTTDSGGNVVAHTLKASSSNQNEMDGLLLMNGANLKFLNGNPGEILFENTNEMIKDSADINGHDIIIETGGINRLDVGTTTVGIGTSKGNAGLSVMSGNVGIGTWNPIQALEVNGTAKMTGFNLSTSPTNNYVLTTDGSGNGTWKPSTGSGTVTNVATDATLTGGPITTTGTLGIATNAAIPGSPTTTTQAVGDNSTKLATTAYVQNQIANQVDMHDPVQAATTTALILSPTYSNGSSGVGATLTAGTVGVLIIDGYTPVLNDRVLVQNQAAPLQNGCYTLTTVGVVVTTDYVLTRCTDFNQVSNISYGDTFPVLQGSTNANQQFTMNNSAFTTVGAAGSTGNITFAQTSGGSQLAAGTNIVITGNSIATTLTPSFTTVNTTGNVGIGTTLMTTSALTVMNGNVGIGTWIPGGSLVVMGGNVGIGTTIPAATFDANKAASMVIPVAAGNAPTALGSIGFDSTQLRYTSGGNQATTGYFPRVLYVSNATNTGSNTLSCATINTTETAFGSAYSVPANFMIQNKVLRITAMFDMVGSATATSQQIHLRWGGVSGTAILTYAVTTNNNDSDKGVGGTWLVQGTAGAGASVNVEVGGAARSVGNYLVANTTQSPVAVTTNSQESLVFTDVCGGNTAGNTMTLRQFIVEELN